MKLYSYFQSSGAYRVRIALNLKGLHPTMEYIDLTKGEQKKSDYLAVNPQGLIPAFISEEGDTLTQSLAIIEYLDERYPNPPLLPKDAVERARVRALALAVACEIAPLGNLKVRKYIRDELHQDEKAWMQKWISEGLAAVEKMLAGHTMTGKFCHGDAPTMADCVVVPQIFNARRWGCDVGAWPTIARIDAACAAHPAFIAAHPDHQPDKPTN